MNDSSQKLNGAPPHIPLDRVMARIQKNFLNPIAEKIMNNMTDKGTGITTQQLKDAPQGALFVWCNGILGYPVEIAAKLGRDDITIVGPEWITNPNNYFGRDFSALIIDHAAELFGTQVEGAVHIRERIKRIKAAKPPAQGIFPKGIESESEVGKI